MSELKYLELHFLVLNLCFVIIDMSHYHIGW